MSNMKLKKIALRLCKLAAPRTFKVARQEILNHLSDSGWKLSDPTLKIPHATSPDGTLRLWFKSQAVYYTKSNEKKHKPKDARTVSYDLDIRKVSPQNFLDWIEKINEKGLLQSREASTKIAEETYWGKAPQYHCPKCKWSGRINSKVTEKVCPQCGKKSLVEGPRQRREK